VVTHPEYGLQENVRRNYYLFVLPHCLLLTGSGMLRTAGTVN